MREGYWGRFSQAHERGEKKAQEGEKRMQIRRKGEREREVAWKFLHKRERRKMKEMEERER